MIVYCMHSLRNYPCHCPALQKADVWSCGVLLFIMLTGRYPFLWEQNKARAAGHQLHYMLQVWRRMSFIHLLIHMFA